MPKDLHYFGNNLDIFNINNICHNFFKYVSIKRNFIYQIEQDRIFAFQKFDKNLYYFKNTIVMF